MAVIAITWTFTKKVAEKIAVGLVSDWIKKKGEHFLGLDRTAFTKELETIIYETTTNYDCNFNIPDEGEKFAFYKSEILIQTLLSIKFIGRDTVNVDNLKKEIEQNPYIINPKPVEIIKFLEIFEENCKTSPTLIKHQFNDNYKEAVFEILNVVDSIQSTLNKVINEIRSSLTNEYFSQLSEIKENIDAFKPKTALERLEKLETRIREKNQMTNEIESRLLFLKGSCIIEISRSIEGAELIVKSYLINNENSLKADAAISYYNLSLHQEAAKLASELIQTDPFNATAWFVLIILKGNALKELWNKIPPSVKAKRGFIVNCIHFILLTNLNDTFVIDELGLKLPEISNERITHSNISLWEKIAYIKLHGYFSSVKQFSINDKGKLQGFQFEGFDELLTLLSRFFDSIKSTEVYDNYPMLRFYYSFCRHLSNDNSFDKDEFKGDYLRLKDSAFQFDLHYAEYLANEGQLEETISLLKESKYNSQEDVLIHRIIYTKTANKDIEATDLLKQHLELVDVIEFKSIFNLNNLFNLFLPNLSLLREEFNKILIQKKFENDSIKGLFETTIQITYFFNETDKEKIKTQLIAIAKNFKSDTDVTFYISQLLHSLEAYMECALLLEPQIVPQKQTQLNLLYATCCFKANKDLTSLLKFLEQIRVNNDNNIYQFLAIENNLRQSIDDIVGLIDIAWRGVKQYSQLEHFHLNLLSALERKRETDSIKEYVEKHLKQNFKDQNIGIWVSSILSRNGYKKEGASILYQLAVKPTNYTARVNYMTTIDFPNDFFIEYVEVEEGSYVKLVGKDKSIKLVSLQDGDKYNLIGKKLRDSIMIKKKVGYELSEYRIERIMNNHLFLFEEILQEAHDPNSELSAESIDFGGADGGLDFEKFEKHFIDRFAVESEMRKKYIDEILAAYNRGEKNFTEICRNVFDSNPLDCYDYLTQNSFFALPAFYNSLLKLSTNETYAIDFTTLILFSDLELKYGIKVDTKFIISTNLISLIQNEIIKLQSVPAPKMTLGVQNHKVVPVFYPDDFNERKIYRYTQLLNYIKEHCIERIIEEKVEFAPLLSNKHANDIYFNYIIDNAFFSTNLQYTLISNDTFIATSFGGLTPKQISPELFLLRYFKGNNRKESIEYFIEKHYVGVIINKDVLLSEYKKKQMGQANNFSVCLLNLKPKWSLTPIHIDPAIKFLKEIYVSDLSLDSEKSLLSLSVLFNLLDGFSQNPQMINLIKSMIYKEFSLLGASLDRVLESFETAIGMYQQ